MRFTNTSAGCVLIIANGQMAVECLHKWQTGSFFASHVAVFNLPRLETRSVDAPPNVVSSQVSLNMPA